MIIGMDMTIIIHRGIIALIGPTAIGGIVFHSHRPLILIAMENFAVVLSQGYNTESLAKGSNKKIIRQSHSPF